MMRTPLLIAGAAMAALIALPGCGSRQKLTAVEGVTPVPPAYGAAAAAGPNELLQPSTQSRPERNVELRRKSEARADDPFDLPPE
ncbi:hypothetical protein C7451_107167 [Blastomonas natatoria]|uniref:Uncharacterized protein n=2 Tax=Blastomonas natatoria TaxID=34015 RepID=A0A2V3V0J2_9SPHN|nr:hypothetical protein C7451_107167 [Blastomonas natatoria]